MKIAHSYRINIPPQVQKVPIVHNTAPAPLIRQNDSLPAFCGSAANISYSGSALLEQMVSESNYKKESPNEIRKVNEIASRYAGKDIKCSPSAAIKKKYNLNEVKLSTDEKEFFSNFLKKYTYDYSEYSDAALLRQSCDIVLGWEEGREKQLANIKNAFEKPKNKEN